MNKLYNRIPSMFKDTRFLLVVVLFVGFVFRLYKIDNPVADWHSWRQADTISVSRLYVDEGIDILHPRYYDISTAQSGLFNPNGWRMVEFPIFNVVNTLLYNLIPVFTIEIWARLISSLAALGSSIFLYKIVSSLSKNKKLGLLTSFFYLTLPFNVYFTRVILPEPLAVFLGLGGIWFSIVFINSNKNYNIYLSTLFFSLALLVKPFIIFYLIPILWLFIKKFGVKYTFSNNFYYFIVFLTVFPLLSWRIWISQFPEGIPFWKWSFNEDGIRFRPAFWRWIFGERVGRLILGIWGLVPFSLGILWSTKKNRFVNIFLFSSLLFVVTIATANVKHDYYQTYMIPSISMALAYGVYYLWINKNFERFVSRAILFLSVFLMYGISLYQVKEFYKINHPQIITAGEAVQKITTTEDLIIAPYNGDTAFLYQTKRFGWPVVDRAIPELIKKGADYYVSVNYDSLTRELMNEFEVVDETDEYVIIKLSK